MTRIVNYFCDLLDTLKRIEKHLETLASTVSHGYGGARPTLRTGKNQWES